LAESISVPSQSLSGQRATTLTHLVMLRLITGYTLLTVLLIGLFGTDWDIQWHVTIGRDRTFTPPHDMIRSGHEPFNVGIYKTSAFGNRYEA
jgi:hypothetical protein